MYTMIPLRQHTTPGITVVADTATAHIINLLARVATARNPLVTVPPSGSLVWSSMGKPD